MYDIPAEEKRSSAALWHWCKAQSRSCGFSERVGVNQPNHNCDNNIALVVHPVHAAHGIAAGGDAWAAHGHCSGSPACFLCPLSYLKKERDQQHKPKQTQTEFPCC